MADEVVGGAAQGAAVGTAIFPGVGTAIGAGIGAIAGFLGSKSKKRALARRRRKLKKLTSAEHLTDVIKKLRPQFREIVAQGLGPQFLSGIAAELGRSGLTGTGVGEALRTAAAAVPGHNVSTSLVTNEAPRRSQLLTFSASGCRFCWLFRSMAGRQYCSAGISLLSRTMASDVALQIDVMLSILVRMSHDITSANLSAFSAGT